MPLSKTQLKQATAILLVVLNCLLAVSVWRQCTHRHTPARIDADTDALMRIELPEGMPDTLLHYPGFDIHFNPETHIANCAVYEITAREAAGTIERFGYFTADRTVEGCALPDDYTASGYDRGHLVPASDLQWDSAAMRASFLMTNVCPQKPVLNEGGWAKLEQKVREWALRDSALIVVAGPVPEPLPMATRDGDDGPRHIGITGVTVPRRIFKVVLAHRATPVRAVAFVYPNGEADGRLRDYAVAPAEVERLTGMRLFAVLPDSVRDPLMHSTTLTRWLE